MKHFLLQHYCGEYIGIMDHDRGIPPTKPLGLEYGMHISGCHLLQLLNSDVGASIINHVE